MFIAVAQQLTLMYITIHVAKTHVYYTLYMLMGHVYYTLLYYAHGTCIILYTVICSLDMYIIHCYMLMGFSVKASANTAVDQNAEEHWAKKY